MDAANNSECCMLSLKWTSFSCISTWLLICICLLLKKTTRLLNQEFIWLYSLFVDLKIKKVHLQNCLWCFTLWIYSINYFLRNTWTFFFTFHVDVFFYAWNHWLLCSYLFSWSTFPKTLLVIYFNEAGYCDCNDCRSM